MTPGQWWESRLSNAVVEHAVEQRRNALANVFMSLPAWARRYARRIGQSFPTPEARMELVIDLARRNVEERTGGPFGAAVFERESGRLVAMGVNGVERLESSLAHAEVMAIVQAERRLGVFDLGGPGQPAHELVSSAQPCAMCLGALIWSGVTRLAYAATRRDVEETVGFDEGPVPRKWQDELAMRGIDTANGLLQAQAREVLRRYQEAGGKVYNGRRAMREARPSRGSRRRAAEHS